jgi:2-C-methyl-D-erythritol 4-phosphate cytidylyltransferase
VTAAVIVVAAGRGERAGGRADKVLQSLAGRLVLRRSILPFLDDPRIVRLVLVVPPGREAEYRAAAFPEPPPASLTVDVLAGGARRQDSVAHGLAAIPEGIDLVAVHDAARPLLRAELVARLLEAAATVGAAVPGVSPADTITLIDRHVGLLSSGLDRSRLLAVQTPQVIRRDWLIDAHRAADAGKIEATDDAGLVQRLGHPVAFVAGDTDNIKLTLESDFDLAEALLAARARAVAGPAPEGR